MTVTNRNLCVKLRSRQRLQNSAGVWNGLIFNFLRLVLGYKQRFISALLVSYWQVHVSSQDIHHSRAVSSVAAV